MSLELVKDTIKVNQVIGQDVTQAIIENDIIVPDVKPDASKVLVIDADAVVSSTEVLQDKMIIGGSIFYKVLYVSDNPDQPVKGINTSVSFTCGLDIPSARHGMKGMAKCSIEHIDHEILNGRKINIKTILKAEGKVSEIADYEVANDIRGIEDIQTLKENVSVNCFLGENDSKFTFVEELSVPEGKPAALEILRNDIKITGKEYKISDGTINVKGILNISTLYTADDEENSMQYMENEAAFSYPLEIENITEESFLRLEIGVVDSKFEIGEDSDGEPRVVNCEIELDIYGSASEKRGLEIITDTYSPSAKVIIDKSQLRVEDVTTKFSGQVNIKDSIPVNEEIPKIMQVYNVLCKPVLAECTPAVDKILVEGIVSCKLIYLAEESEQPVYCINQEIPFKQNVEVKGMNQEMPFDIALDIDHMSYSILSSSEIELRICINITADITSYVLISAISKVADMPLDDKKLAAAPSITIYFTQPKDTLWIIAKKYYTTVGDLVKVNNIVDKDNIYPGQQIIIPRKPI